MSQTNHLLVRKGVFYYHRRVPLPLVGELGKKVILFSLGTRDAKEAKKRRAAEVLKWAILLRLRKRPRVHTATTTCPAACRLGWWLDQAGSGLRRTHRRAAYCRALSDPPASQLEKDEIKADIEIGLDISRTR